GARAPAAVEAGGVVGRHGAVVVGPVGVDQTEALDRVAGLEQLAQHDQDPAGVVAVHDQLALVDAPVEAPVVGPEQPQLSRADRAAPPAGVTEPPPTPAP